MPLTPLSLLAVLAAALVPAVVAAADGPTRRPHIILIVADDLVSQRWRHSICKILDSNQPFMYRKRKKKLLCIVSKSRWSRSALVGVTARPMRQAHAWAYSQA